MGTFTAQILIGTSHPNSGGIHPTHTLFLSENSRPAWILQSLENSEPPKVWIPAVESMLKDGLLMIAFYLTEESEIQNLLKSKVKSLEKKKSFYEVLTQQEISNLHQKCQAIKTYPKLSISVFEGSTILSQLKELENYQMELEVCKSCFSRFYSDWQNKTITKGTLKGNF